MTALSPSFRFAVKASCSIRTERRNEAPSSNPQEAQPPASGGTSPEVVPLVSKRGAAGLEIRCPPGSVLSQNWALKSQLI